MGASLTTRFEIEHPDGWSFAVRVPPISVVAQLEELLRDRNERQARRTSELLADSDLAAAVQSRDQEGLAGLLASKYGERLVELTADHISVATRAQIAELVRPYCAEPRGLVDDDGAAMTWAAVQEVNEPMLVSVLSDAALAVYDRTAGGHGRVRLKNFNSSSPS
jgi:hypothetical protein